jgi:hypothetical protein
MAKSAWVVRLAFVAFCAMLVLNVVHAADPDPLADFCVADLSPNAPLVSGFPCIPRSKVTVNDFVYTGFRTAGKCQLISEPRS